jgi:hypothetical protein
MNFLEELVAEWFAYKGCFVRTNVKFGSKPGRSAGGFAGEMDVVAFEPGRKTVVHLEKEETNDIADIRWRKPRVR